MHEIRKKLFGPAASFFLLIDDVVPIATSHLYSFVNDDSFQQWKESPHFNIEQLNYILALEAVDKAHLAAVSSLVRTKRWADATCAMYGDKNFLGWAGCARGLIESTGDILDGLLGVASTLALNHRSIAKCLNGEANEFHNFSEIEKILDHFVLAKWGREKSNVTTAKSNADYVKLLSSVLPEAVEIYQRLCSITHPSADSINYLYEPVLGTNGKIKLSIDRDIQEIDSFYKRYPNAMKIALMMSCNPPLLVLWVLHKFSLHPKLAILKKLDWSTIPAWERIEKSLNK